MEKTAILWSERAVSPTVFISFFIQTNSRRFHVCKTILVLSYMLLRERVYELAHMCVCVCVFASWSFTWFSYLSPSEITSSCHFIMCLCSHRILLGCVRSSDRVLRLPMHGMSHRCCGGHLASRSFAYIPGTPGVCERMEKWTDCTDDDVDGDSAYSAAFDAKKHQERQNERQAKSEAKQN